jgi:hypothetical protein
MSKQAELSRQAVIDEYGEVDRQARLWTPSVNPHLARKQQLEAIIQSWYTELDAKTAAIDEGALYRLEVSAKENRRNMTPAVYSKAFARMKKLKVDVWGCFSTTQAAIKKHLGESFLDELAPKEPRGERNLKVIAKAAPQQAKAA